MFGWVKAIAAGKVLGLELEVPEVVAEGDFGAVADGEARSSRLVLTADSLKNGKVLELRIVSVLNALGGAIGGERSTGSKANGSADAVAPEITAEASVAVERIGGVSFAEIADLRVS